MKIELPGYENTKFASLSGQTSGGVFQPPMDKIPMGLLSTSAPSYLAPARVEEFASAKDSLNRNMAYSRAFAKIDYPIFQPHDEEDWGFLRAVGAVAGTMADYSFAKLKERQDQEDMIFVTESKGMYQRDAQKLWAEKYEKKLTGYASQNEEVHKQFQAELGATWDGIINRAPSREAARVAAMRSKVELDNSIMTHAAEKSIQFESKYAFKTADEAVQSKISEIQTTKEIGVGPERARKIEELMGLTTAFGSSGRGNALLAAELRDKGVKELGRAIIMADAKNAPEQFLSKWKKGEYEIPIGTGLPGENGEPGAKIMLLTDEVRTLGTTHAASLQQTLALRAQTAALKAAGERDRGLQTSVSNYSNANSHLAKNFGELNDDEFLKNVDISRRNLDAAIGYDPKNETLKREKVNFEDSVEAMSMYRQLGDGSIKWEDIRSQLEGKDLTKSVTLEFTKSKTGEKKVTQLRGGVAARLNEFFMADTQALIKDPGALDKRLQPRFEAAYKAAGITNPSEPEAITVRTQVRREYLSATIGERGLAYYHNGETLSKAELAALEKDIDSAVSAPEAMNAVGRIGQIGGTSTMMNILSKGKTNAMAALGMMIRERDPAMGDLAASYITSAHSGKKGDTVAIQPQERASLVQAVNDAIMSSSWFKTERLAVPLGGHKLAESGVLDGVHDALLTAALDRKGKGATDEEIKNEIKAMLSVMDRGVVHTDGYVGSHNPLQKELKIDDAKMASTADKVRRDILKEELAVLNSPATDGDPKVIGGLMKRWGYRGDPNDPTHAAEFLRRARLDAINAVEGTKLVYLKGRWAVAGADGKQIPLTKSQDQIKMHFTNILYPTALPPEPATQPVQNPDSLERRE